MKSFYLKPYRKKREKLIAKNDAALKSFSLIWPDPNQHFFVQSQQ